MVTGIVLYNEKGQGWYETIQYPHPGQREKGGGARCNKTCFLKERGEEIGDRGSTLILDGICEKLAPEFYNQGVRDSCHCMKDVLSIQK